MLVKCLNCNKEYDSTVYKNTQRRNTFFCSEACLDNWNKDKNKKYAICEVCGKSFLQLRLMNGSYKETKICQECKDKDLVQCLYCGKYYPNVRNERGTRITYYCSKECNEKWNAECNTKTRICKNCGKSFIVHRDMNNYYSEDIYCSYDCMIESLHKQSENNEKPSICKYCGKEFYQDRIERTHKDGFKYFEKTNKRYCSEECYKKACQYSYNYKAERVCSCCGKKFIAEQYTEKDEIVKREPRLLGLYKKGNTCSYECYRKLVGKEYKKTCLSKYGVTSCAKLDSSKKKTIKTCMERYGVAYGLFTKQALEANKLGNKSKINENFAILLEKLNIKYNQEFAIQNYLYDFYLPESNVLIELNPSFTHTTIDTTAFKGKDKNYHLDKTNVAVNAGYRCINVWDWDDVFKIIISCKPKQKLYARKLILREVTKQQANEFLDEYHIQNSCYGNHINLGLYDNEQLVQIMTFGKPRYNKNYQYELLRLCSHSDYIIVGGAEKLFKHFTNNYNPESIISYCDVSKFSGDVYSKLGFDLLRQSAPQKIWNKKNSKEYITDNLLRQRGFDQLVGSRLNPPQLYGKGTDNEKLMIRYGWLPIYDCGQKVFVWA